MMSALSIREAQRRGAATAVVYVSDARYHELTEFSIASLLLNQPSELAIYFFQVGYTKPVQAPLAVLAQTRGSVLTVKTLDRNQVTFRGLEVAALHSHISDVTLFKAHAIESVVRDHEQMVFVDSDVLAFPGLDLRRPFGFSTTLAGVYDFVSYMPFDGQDLIGHTRRTGVSSDYFNAGVVFIRSDRWMQNRYLDLFTKNLLEHSRHCPYRHDAFGNDPRDCKGADQCALNMSAQYDWTPLGFSWNAQKPIRHTDVWKGAVLRHYTGHRKFLAKSNVNRDWREFHQIRTINNEAGLKSDVPIRYDGGLLYAADFIKYRQERRGYKTLLESLNVRMLDEQAGKTTNSASDGSI